MLERSVNMFRSILVLVAIGSWLVSSALSMETLLLLKTSKEAPRISEADLIELSDDRLCVVYTRYTAGGDDHDPADLVMQTSADGGMTWASPKVLLPNEGKCNVMSVTLRRLSSGELLLFYLRKDRRDSESLYVRRSSDEFMTLSEPVRVTQLDGYHVVNNDRVFQCSTGRLIVPAALHTGFDDENRVTPPVEAGVPIAYYSDDKGCSWCRDETPILSTDERKLILQEPGIVELSDGRLFMYMRTHHGSQFGCFSSDNGLSWSEPKPTPLIAPASPATIERCPWTRELFCVFNDYRSGDTHRIREGQRTPLCMAVSADEGKTWGKSIVLEDNPEGEFCYTSMTWQKDRLLLTYHDFTTRKHGPQSGDWKIVALSKKWLNEKLAAAQSTTR